MKPLKIQISRELAAEFGREAVQIIQKGYYTTNSGKTVQVGNMIDRAIKGSRSCPPDQTVPESLPGPYDTQIGVQNETSLAAALKLIQAGHHPAVLNFASATHPGGGFLNGAGAQEEYLARSSGLYACLVNNDMYPFHRARHDPLYMDYAIYSPDVPVSRADDGTPLDQPYVVGIITSPAVNANELLQHHPHRRTEICPAMWTRILKVLAIGAIQGHDAMVLGAWGCGAFGNDSREIAELFRKALQENFRGTFQRVLFAIVDWSEEERFIGPFRKVFWVEKLTKKFTSLNPFYLRQSLCYPLHTSLIFLHRRLGMVAGYIAKGHPIRPLSKFSLSSFPLMGVVWTFSVSYT